MELELQKKSFVCYETVLDACTNHEETSDVIVPDSSPDILRILGAFGSVFLKDEGVNDRKYSVNGLVSGWVLYVSEGDLTVRRLEVNIPFVHTFEHAEIDPEQIGVVEMCLANLEAREINPRKVTVRANIAICAKTHHEVKLEFPSGVGDTEMHGVECKTRNVSLYAPIDFKKKTVQISEDVELSSTQQEFASMLRYDAKAQTLETKIIGSKAVVKGTVCLTCLYLTKDGEIASFTRELPYSQILEMDRLHDDCALETKLHLGDLKLDPQYDMSGDVHYLTLNLPIRMCATVWEQSEYEVLDDLYSVKYPLNIQNGVQRINSGSGRMQKRISVIESIPCEMQADQILDTTVCMEPIRKRLEEGEYALTNGMQVNVLYRAKDGSVCCATRRMESVCPLPNTTHEYRAVSTLSGVNTSIEPMNEVSVKLSVDYDLDEFLPMDITMPCRIEVESEVEEEKNGPSVMIRKIRPGETLWKLAKEYRTTIDDIMMANSLESDEIYAGDMILIPQKRK